MKKIPLLFLLFLFLNVSYIYAQKSEFFGNSFLRNFSPKEYNSSAQIWAIEQDSRGIMYFGDTQRLNTYDGSRWIRYEVANNSVVRSIDIDSISGIIYVGSAGEFGFFLPDTLGLLQYHSLSDLLDEKDKDFNDVWGTYVTANGVYFTSKNKIFKWSGKKLSIVNENLNSNYTFNFNNQIYAISEDKGLVKIEDTSVVVLTNCEEIKDDCGFICTNQLSDNEIIISTSLKGIFIYNFETKQLQKITTQENVDLYLSKNIAYSFAVIDPQTFAIGTIMGGIIILNRNGEIVRVINTDRGLQSNAVSFLFVDKNKNLWAGLQNGISLIDISTPITYYSDKNGLDSYPTDVIKFKDRFYVATLSDCFYLSDYSLQINNDNHLLKQFPKINGVWAFMEYNDNLFGFGTEGLLQIVDTTAKMIYSKDGIMLSGGYSPKFPEHVFAGMKNSFIALKIKDDNSNFSKIESEYVFPEITEEIRKVVADKDGNLWLSTESKGIIFIRFTGKLISDYQLTKFGEKSFSNTNRNKVDTIDNKIVILTSTGIYKPVFPDKNLPDSLISFVYDKYWTKQFTIDSSSVSELSKLDKNTFVVSTNGAGVLTFEKDTVIWDQKPFSLIGKFTSVFSKGNQISYILTSDAIYIYDHKIKKEYKKPYKTLIRKVTINKDSIIYYGNYRQKLKDSIFSFSDNQTDEFKYKVDYKFNSFTFEYSSTFFEEDENLNFSYILEGFDDNWSNYNEETKAVYTNIPEGSYIFKVKAENIYGEESEIATYEFSIFPPWYRSWWAYLGYIIMAVFVIWLVVKINSKRLVKTQKKLEAIVKQRTIEITQQKEEIQVQADKLYSANASITEKNDQVIASIRYAKTIQTAILPFEDRIGKQLDFFVLFKPKDIVSGDFYWYSYIESQSFIAVVDCTGHGVPGAFMSMIGSQLLNKIVNEDKIFSPAEILYSLDMEVKRALKQEESNNIDGMDVCLCRIKKEKDSQKTVFAGAKRPLFYYKISENQLVKINGNRKSIGRTGRKSRSQDNFTNNEVVLHKNDMIYLSTDGYVDQNNIERKRLGTVKLTNIISEIAEENLEQQKQTLENQLNNWQLSEKQRDDITIIGIKLK